MRFTKTVCCWSELLSSNTGLLLNMMASMLRCGTAACRMPWPEGTVIFEVAAPEVHAAAKAKLDACKARVPRGSLLRRINADLQVLASQRAPHCMFHMSCFND